MTTDSVASIAAVAVDLARVQPAETLTARELRTVTDAATWYAKYHESMIAGLADDRSALAVSRREQFAELRAALGKLGVKLRPPAGSPAGR